MTTEIEIAKHVPSPDVYLLRNKMRAQAKDGRMPKTPCPHPMRAVDQMWDEEPGRAGRPTNLFICGACHQPLRLVDFHGREAADG